MSHKIGRNDPCLCGSGKKYKHCCLLKTQEAAATRKGHDGAVERAIDWLIARHGKAVMHAIDAMLFDGLSDEEQSLLRSLDAETWQGIQINATEWLLAEGQILVKNEYHRVTGLLLGLGGPMFTADQRRWIEQLSERPLRLYDVTDVVPGQQMTLCDALDINAAPVVVQEKSGSQASLIGTRLGARLMEVDGHHELSGGVYPFSHLAGNSALAAMKEAENQLVKHPEDLPGFMSFMVRRKWVEQFIRPPEMPTLMDTSTGAPILLVTDHYRVRDWDALAQALANKKDVDGDRASGWSRLRKCSDGLTRAISSINIGEGPDRIELFHKTQGEADKGRKWFEKLAGNSVEFAGRVVSDPKGMMKNMPAGKARKSSPTGEELPPDVAAGLIEQTIHRMYANWADEPLAALGGKTPRQSIATPAGLERVKGLLKSYEASERERAIEQGRRAISYSFLWNAIGLSLR